MNPWLAKLKTTLRRTEEKTDGRADQHPFVSNDSVSAGVGETALPPFVSNDSVSAGVGVEKSPLKQYCSMLINSTSSPPSPPLWAKEQSMPNLFRDTPDRAPAWAAWWASLDRLRRQTKTNSNCSESKNRI